MTFIQSEVVEKITIAPRRKRSESFMDAPIFNKLRAQPDKAVAVVQPDYHKAQLLRWNVYRIADSRARKDPWYKSIRLALRKVEGSEKAYKVLVWLDEQKGSQ